MAADGQATLSIGRVLALSWSVFAARWLSFAGLMLIGALLAAAAIGMLFFGCIVIIEAIPSRGGGGFDFNDTQTAIMWAVLFCEVVAGIAVLQIGAAAVAFGTVQYLRGQQTPFGRCLSHGFTVMLPACAAALIVGAPLAGLVLLGFFTINGAFFLAAPVLALLLAVPFLVVVPAAALERAGIRQALARSVSLMRGNYLRLLGLLLLLAAASFAGTVLLGLASDILWDFTFLISIAALLAIAVFAAIAVAVTYVELRRIKEGFGAEEVAKLFD
jgi:hypothetical protein